MRGQRQFVARFSLHEEHYRTAPPYDFAAGAPPGAAWYERLGWPMTRAHWRGAAGRALRALDLHGKW